MIYAVLLLGGTSKRMNLSTPKQFLKLNERDLFTYSYEILANIEEIDKIILVTGNNYLEHVYDVVSNFKIKKDFEIVLGGESRQESVFNSLKAINKELKDDDLVLIHDSCRPLVTTDIVNNIIKNGHQFKNCTLYLPIYDSVVIKNDEEIGEYLDRNKLALIQTPQIFNYKDLYEAHLYAIKNNINVNDDASLLVNMKKNIKLIEGDQFNFKITTFDDLMILKSILEGR